MENIGVVFIKSIKNFLAKRELIGITWESIVTTPKMLAAWVELAQFPPDQSIGINIRSIMQNIIFAYCPLNYFYAFNIIAALISYFSSQENINVVDEDNVIVIGPTTTQASVTSSESWAWSPPASTQGGGWTPWTPTTTATTETNFADSSTVEQPLSGDYKVVCCKL